VLRAALRGEHRCEDVPLVGDLYRHGRGNLGRDRHEHQASQRAGKRSVQRCADCTGRERIQREHDHEPVLALDEHSVALTLFQRADKTKR